MIISTRAINPQRYRRKPKIYLDYDDGGYTNTSVIVDGDADTDIVITESGHAKKGGHKRSITFMGRHYPVLREAIYAYEDALSDAEREMGAAWPST